LELAEINPDRGIPMRIFRLLTVAAAAAALYHLYKRDQERRSAAAELASYDDGKPVSDEVLADRVRKRIAHTMLNASNIDARASRGVVMLRGTVSRVERDQALAAVLAVPGVTRVANYLEAFEPPQEQRLAF
jgi:osmotically-inducible protein OsmY